VTAVPAILATPRVLAALRALLLADATLTARLAKVPGTTTPAIYTEGYVPADARTDYLVIGPFTERSTPTMGDGYRWGSELTLPIKLVTQNANLSVCHGTIDRIVALLHGVPLTVQDYAHGMALLETTVDAYSELIAGVKVWHFVTLWNVAVHQVGGL
jgi:hypothetical protein